MHCRCGLLLLYATVTVEGPCRVYNASMSAFLSICSIKRSSAIHSSSSANGPSHSVLISDLRAAKHRRACFQV